MGGWDRFERLGHEGEVHGMTFLALEIDEGPGKDSVDRGDAAETPAPVHAIPSLDQPQQRFHMLPPDLPRGDQFVQFFLHKTPIR
jgi:hypothetical protein